MVALVGESGSGKTTLLRCFNRMVDPDAGRVEVAGRDVRGRDPVQANDGGVADGVQDAVVDHERAVRSRSGN